MAGKETRGRPRFNPEPMEASLRVRLTPSAFKLLEAAVAEELGGAASIADVQRQALDYYFENHPKAKALAARLAKKGGA